MCRSAPRSYSENLVREKGVEPPRLAALEPKSSASTNSATLALISHFTRDNPILSAAAVHKILQAFFITRKLVRRNVRRPLRKFSRRFNFTAQVLAPTG